MQPLPWLSTALAQAPAIEFETDFNMKETEREHMSNEVCAEENCDHLFGWTQILFSAMKVMFLM